MSDDEKQIEELAKELFLSNCPSHTWPNDADTAFWKRYARIARDHFAANLPAVDEGKRRELIGVVQEVIVDLKPSIKADVADKMAEERLVKRGLIPPAKVPSMGERFMKGCTDKGVISPAMLLDIVERIDSDLGPSIEWLKASAKSGIPEAKEILANLEAKLGGGK